MDLAKLIEYEFPHDDGLCYLNHAAVAPWPKRTSDAVKTFAEKNNRQGALDYPEWVRRETILRGQLQRLINAPSINDIALLKNTSEALSVVACGLEWHAGDNIVSTNQEFPSNRIPWQAQEELGVNFHAVDIGGHDDPELHSCGGFLQ